MMVKNLFLEFLHFIYVIIIFKILGSFLPSLASDTYRHVADALLLICIARMTFGFTKKLFFKTRIQPKNKAVLITGCGSGFGFELAKRLDSLGFKVFATCHYASGKGPTALRETCSGNLHVLELDVKSDESVKNALNFVKKNLGTCELWAVVNNAGIQKGFTSELSSMADFRETIEVNTFGILRVTKAFVPLLRTSKGRIINVLSVSSDVTFYVAAPYVVSKHAAKALGDCYRQELEAWGIRVIQIKPEFFQTPILYADNILRRAEESFRNLDEDIKEFYGEAYLEKLKAYMTNFEAIGSTKIHLVINDLESAICLEDPDFEYRVCRNVLMKFLMFLQDHSPKTVQPLFIKALLILTSYPDPILEKTRKKEQKFTFYRNIMNTFRFKILKLSGLYSGSRK